MAAVAAAFVAATRRRGVALAAAALPCVPPFPARATLQLAAARVLCAGAVEQRAREHSHAQQRSQARFDACGFHCRAVNEWMDGSFSGSVE